MSLSRRDVIKMGVFGGAAMALPLNRLMSVSGVTGNRMPTSGLPLPFSLPFKAAQSAAPIYSKQDPVTGDWVDLYEYHMRATNLNILGPGRPNTATFTYNGQIPGPTIRTRQGRRTVVRHCNDLPNQHPTLSYNPWTSVHLHGSASLPQYDGYASDITMPAEYKNYRYPNHQNARTLWYHDHGVHHTAENAYSGLIAQYHILDGSEADLQLPQGPYDQPMFIHDMMFQSDGSPLFNLDDDSGMYGDVICVNGTPWPFMNVEPRKYRFRFLVGNVARSYKFSFSNGMPAWVISGDGGLHQYAQKVTSWKHIMAERYDVIIDFAPYKGKTINMLNTSPKNNVDFTNVNKVMQFRVGRTVTDSSNNMPYLDTSQARNVQANVYSTQIPLSKALDPVKYPASNTTMDLSETDAANYGQAPRRLHLKRAHGEWTFNERTWKTVEQSNFTHVEANPLVGTSEIWDLVNDSGGWHHPLHIHLVDFKILSRNGQPPKNYERCPKDVVFLGENETIRVLAKFDTIGRYMVHCHNLLHEDHDMMTQFAVVRDQSLPVDHPVNNTMHWDDEFAAPYRGAWWSEAGSISLDPLWADKPEPKPDPMPPLEDV